MTEIRDLLQDNPASRLLSILHRAIDMEYGDNDKSAVIWAKVLKVENKPSELFPAYSKLFILTDEAYEAVSRFYPKQLATHAAWQKGISKCLQSNSLYHHPWKQAIDQLKSSNIIDMLQVAEDNLAHYVVRTFVDELSIEKLKEEFEDLKIKISEESSFSSQLKYFLVGELEKILNALDRYELNGSSPIRDAIYNIVSNVDLEKNDKFSFRKQLFGFLVVAATSISIINDVAVLPASLSQLKDKIFTQNEIYIGPNIPKLRALPKELAIFRKEELELGDE